MTTRELWRGLCALIVSSAIGSPAAAQQPPPDSPQARKIAALVEKAAALVESRGKAAAFGEFRKRGSEWFDGETYRIDGTSGLLGAGFYP